MISNSGSDSRGRYRGDAAGDQNGMEWRIRTWYDRPWHMALWHPNQAVNDLVADLAIESANNNHVGYDQDERETFWEHLKASNYRPSQITEDCEADCSSGVVAVIKAVGFLLGMDSLKAIPTDAWTGNMREVLTRAGFNVYTDMKYRNTDAYLPRGAVLLNVDHHTCIHVGNGAILGDQVQGGNLVRRLQAELNAQCGASLAVDGEWGQLTKAASSVRSAILRKGDKGNMTRILQEAMNAKGYQLEIDGDFGPATESSLLDWQLKNGLVVDGEVGGNTWQTLLS